MQEQQPGEVIVPLREGEASPSQPDTGVVSAADVPSQSEASQMPTDAPPPQTTSEEFSTHEPAVTTESVPVPTEQSVPPQAEPRSTEQVPMQPDDGTISWEADEFIVHDKTRAWYGAIAIGSVIISAAVYFLNKDIVTALLVLVALIGLAAFSGRRPRRQHFIVAPEGIQVGRMFYDFRDFRSFSVAEERTGHSLVLISLKRFVPAITVYIPPEYEETVVNLVASILPMEPHTPDAIERLTNRLHF